MSRLWSNMFRQPLRMSDWSQVLSLFCTDYWRLKLSPSWRWGDAPEKYPDKKFQNWPFSKKTCQILSSLDTERQKSKAVFGLNVVVSVCVFPCHLQKVVLHHRHIAAWVPLPLFKYQTYKPNKSYSKQLSLLPGCKIFLNLSEAS